MTESNMWNISVPLRTSSSGVQPEEKSYVVSLMTIFKPAVEQVISSAAITNFVHSIVSFFFPQQPSALVHLGSFPHGFHFAPLSKDLNEFYSEAREA